MLGFGRKGHGKRHDIASAKDHKGDIYDALINAVHALTAANVAVDTQTLNDAISAAIIGMDWQSTITRFEAMVTNEPGAPSNGDRYISTEAGTIPSTTQAVLVDDVCQWDTATALWIVTTPDDGWAVQETGVDPNIAWWYSGAAWRKLGTMVDHNNLLNVTANQHHNELHDIDSTSVHNGVAGSAINEVVKFDTDGLPAISKLKHIFESRGVPETGNDYIEIGKFTQAQGSFAIIVAVSSINSAASLSGSDLYYIVGNYDETLAAWQLAYPIQTIEPHSQLCVMIDDDELHLRLIAITSTMSPVTVKVQIIDMGVGNAVFTAASGTGTMGLPATTFPSTLISQVAGSVQMHGEMSMNTEKILDVVDPIAAQGVATKNYVDVNKYTDAEALLAAFANIDTKSFENLLIDGDFEGYGVSNFWNGFGPTIKTIESVIVKIGLQSAKLGVPAPAPTAAYMYQDVPDFTRYQGREVTFNIWARCPAGNANDSLIEIDDGVGVTTSSVVPKDDAWHLMSITHTMDAAATRLRAIIYLRKNVAVSMTDIMYADGCIVVEGDSCPAYGDCSPLYRDISGIFQEKISLAGILPVDADIAAWGFNDRGFGRSAGIAREFLMFKSSDGIRYKELSVDKIISIDNGDSPYLLGYPQTTLLCDATGGDIVVNLTQVVKYVGVVQRIKKIDGSANTVTVTPNGIETIDGAASKVLSTQYEDIEFIGDGTGWHVFYPIIHGISDNTKHSGSLVNDNITLGDANGLVKDSGVTISSIVGGLNYQGTWNATTNIPALADGTGTKGHYYRVSVGGTQDLGSGNITFVAEDFVAHNGAIWQKIDHTDQVTSVFTRQGAVVALASDYDASQIDNDSGVAGVFVDDALDTLAGLIPVGTFPVNCSQGSNLAGNQTIYCGPQGEFSAEAEAQIRMEKSEVLRLTINTSGNTLNTNSTLQVRKNGVAAGAAITILATTASRQTLVLSQSFADGDLLSVELILGGTVGQRLDVRELIVIAKAVV